MVAARARSAGQVAARAEAWVAREVAALAAVPAGDLPAHVVDVAPSAAPAALLVEPAALSVEPAARLVEPAAAIKLSPRR